MYMQPVAVAVVFRGLGALPCSSVNVPAGFVGPIDCDPSSGAPNYPASQSQLASMWDAISSGSSPSSGDQGCGPGINPNCSGGGFGAWLQANALMLGLGLSGAALFVSLLGHRR
jgi:hypothetical protein